MISASWVAVVLAGKAVSGIELAQSPLQMAALRATYTTPADAVARDSCKEAANMLVVGPVKSLDLYG
jgi:hypothetical protein